MKSLQFIQNNAARLVKKRKRNCSITPVLKDLHWLQVGYWVQYEVPLQLYKCLCDKGPVYLSQLLKPCTPKKNLRSSEEYQLKVTGVRKAYASCAFVIVGPRLCSTLPRNH